MENMDYYFSHIVAHAINPDPKSARWIVTALLKIADLMEYVHGEEKVSIEDWIVLQAL